LLQQSDKDYKAGIVNTILPEPLDESVYEKGIYVDIHQATDLRGFTVAENWEPTDQRETRAGFVNIPVLETTQIGSSFTFSFTGNAIGIAILSGPDAGIIEYIIDNRRPEKLDLQTQWSYYLHLPWYLLLADGLKEGEHVLNVKTLPDNENITRNACRIVHFLVN
jgi:sialidase-1